MKTVSKKKIVAGIIVTAICVAITSFKNEENNAAPYISAYTERLEKFRQSQSQPLTVIGKADIHSPADIETIKEQIQIARNHLKGLDFWLRYMEPIAYKKINGPLPVEWETEVFEKFEKPYKREGAGLTLASLYLEEENSNKDSLANLIKASIPQLKPTAQIRSPRNLSLITIFICVTGNFF